VKILQQHTRWPQLEWQHAQGRSLDQASLQTMPRNGLPGSERMVHPLWVISCSSESGTAWTLCDEIYSGSDLPMDRTEQQWNNSSTKIRWCRGKFWSHRNLDFECTESMGECMVVRRSRRLRFSINGIPLRFLEFETTTAQDLAGPIFNRRKKYWTSSICWHNVRRQNTWIQYWSNQSDVFYSAGEEFAPSLRPSAGTGAMKKAAWCKAFAPKNIVVHENDHAQVML
jgi:hypothetical protein